MAKAWIENGLVFVGPPEIAPEDAIDVPDNTTPQDLKIENGKLTFRTDEEKADELREILKKSILAAAKAKIEEKLINHGYYNISDVIVYAQRNDQEANKLLQWYLNFDANVWNVIDELNQKNLEELKKIDINQLVNSCCETVEQNKEESK